MFPLVMNAPPSPPETNAAFGSAPIRVHHHQTVNMLDSASVAGPASADTVPVSRLRRQPSIFYNSPSSQRGESHHRSSSVSSKLLVVVVPPMSVVQEHGNLGHTLFSGPSHRLGQGIIMPLFPNMYGQLTAIAKEFNFPSIAGVCLYYCYHDADVTMTPRLSEEIWATIWGLTDQSRERRLPIAGRLEFDIDVGKARWYAAWLSSRQREPMDYPFYNHGAATAPSQHYRGDSRFTFPKTVVTDDMESEAGQHIQQRSAPVSNRHVPRKLSLVERYDVGSGTELAVHHVLDSQTAIIAPMSSHVLSPIKQLEEPKSARAELDNKVNTWRASAIAIATPDTTEHAGLASVPEPSSPSEVPLRLEDYAWSVSSLGPDDNASIAYASDYYVPSIHLADRAYGSVVSTASYCTSPGPSDYSVNYPWSVSSRLPSPDLAHRMFDDAPQTPMTATSWGAPSQYAYSLSSGEYEYSIDLGHRGYFSRPVTPGTATSWGAPSVYDDEWYTLDNSESPYSVHMCDRGQFSRPVTPQTATSWGASTGPSSPLSPYRLPTPDVAHRAFEDVTHMVLECWPGRPWRHGWPYNVKSNATSSRWVPVIDKVIKRKVKTKQGLSEGESTGYPHFNLYPAVQQSMMHYPHFNLYPLVHQQSPSLRSAGYPDFVLYPPSMATSTATMSVQSDSAHNLHQTDAVPTAAKPLTCAAEDVAQMVIKNWPGPWRHAWPYNVKPKTNPVKASSRWAPAVSKVIKRNAGAGSPGYPHNLDNIYAVASPKGKVSHSLSSRAQYPHFDIYPAVYPYNLDCIYSRQAKPLATKSTGTKSVVNSRSQYPFFELYPAVYPFNLNDIYPSHNGVVKASREGSVKFSGPQYPLFNLYPAVYPFNLAEIYPQMNAVSQPCRQPLPATGEKAQYPFFELYPAVYPFSLERIYAHIPGSHAAGERPKPSPMKSAISFYPYLEIYQPVYPYNLVSIYPGPSAKMAEQQVEYYSNANAGYPCFEIYAPAYPFLSPYPPLAGSLDISVKDTVAPSSTSNYLYFNIYPPVYPHFDIYPSAAGNARRDTSAVSSTTRSDYPYLTIYGPVYPHFDLYPSPAGVNLEQVTDACLPPSTTSNYPYFTLYPSVYPHFDLYPFAAGSSSDRKLAAPLVLSTPPYPYFELYPAVYPHFKLWPTLEPSVERPLRPASVPQPAVPSTVAQQPEQPAVNKEVRRHSGRLTHAELHAVAMMQMKGGRGEMWSDVLGSFPSVPRLPDTLSRSSSLSIPRGSRVSIGLPSSPRAGGVQPDGVSRSLSVSSRNRTSGLAQRRSIWESNVNATPLPSRPTTMKPEARHPPAGRRDSIVLQRVKTLNSTSPTSVPTSKRF